LFDTEVMVAMTTSATPFQTKDPRVVLFYTASTLFLPRALAPMETQDAHWRIRDHEDEEGYAGPRE